MLDDAPWTWKGGRNIDPGLTYNVFDDLDTTPVRNTAAWQASAQRQGTSSTLLPPGSRAAGGAACV